MVGGSALGLVKNQPVENVRGAVELSRRGVRALGPWSIPRRWPGCDGSRVAPYTAGQAGPTL